MKDKEKRAITMADIARLANVSKPTVSRALSNNPLVNEKTRNRVLSVAAEHGYAVNRNAQKLRHKRTNTIAVSMDFRSHRQNRISDPFMKAFEKGDLDGMVEAWSEMGPQQRLEAVQKGQEYRFSIPLEDKDRLDAAQTPFDFVGRVNIGQLEYDARAEARGEPRQQPAGGSMCEARYGEKDWYDRFGYVYYEFMLLGQLEQAEPLLLEGYAGVAEARPRDRITKNAVRRLVDFYVATDNPDEAERFRQLMPGQ